MASVVADTHAIVWYLTSSSRLSATARASMSAAEAARDTILVPAISLVELVYLTEKGRIPRSQLEQLLAALSDPDSALKVVPLDAGVAQAVALVPRDEVPDMPDRIIAATALYLKLPLISRDGKIRASTVHTIW